MKKINHNFWQLHPQLTLNCVFYDNDGNRAAPDATHTYLLHMRQPSNHINKMTWRKTSTNYAITYIVLLMRVSANGAHKRMKPLYQDERTKFAGVDLCNRNMSLMIKNGYWIIYGKKMCAVVVSRKRKNWKNKRQCWFCIWLVSNGSKCFSIFTIWWNNWNKGSSSSSPPFSWREESEREKERMKT